MLLCWLLAAGCWLLLLPLVRCCLILLLLLFFVRPTQEKPRTPPSPQVAFFVGWLGGGVQIHFAGRSGFYQCCVMVFYALLFCAMLLCCAAR